VIIGLVAGVVCFIAATSLKRLLRYDDSLDAFGVHGIGGIVGALLTGVFASKEISGLDGSVLTQLEGVAVTVVYGFTASFVILKIIDKTIGLRVTEEQEREGLDISLHGKASNSRQSPRPGPDELEWGMIPFLDLALIAVIVIALSGLRVAQEYERGVVFRLGRYRGLRGPGLYWIIPLNIERAVSVDIRTRTVSAEQQETITRDSVTIKVNAVLWYRIVDASRSVIEVADAPAAVYQLALTGLRNIIGQHDLDDILQERNKINTLLGDNISGSTAAWGLEVQRFEMKDVELPKAMQQVMAMQAEAIREKRARIIKAEAELEASVKLSAAAAQITMNPVALELRRMQMISEVGAENNSTTVLMIPSDFVSLAHNLSDFLQRQAPARSAGEEHR